MKKRFFSSIMIAHAQNNSWSQLLTFSVCSYDNQQPGKSFQDRLFPKSCQAPKATQFPPSP